MLELKIQSDLVVVFLPSWLPLWGYVVMWLVLATIIFFIQELYDKRKGKKKQEHGERQSLGEAGRVEQAQNDPARPSRAFRKFNRRNSAIASIVSLVSIVFGIDYFWTIPASPTRDFFAGFLFVISGVFVLAFYLRSYVLYKVQEEFYSGKNP